MFVGYSLDHTADCYKMWDPATSRVHQPRDVTWLNRMYYNREPTNNIVVEPDMEPVIVYHTDNPAINGPGEGDNQPDETIDENEDIDDNNGVHNLPDEFFDAETEQMGNTPYGIDIPTTSTSAGRISRPPPRLIESATMAQAMNEIAADYKCELTLAEEQFYDTTMRELNEMSLIGAGIGGGFIYTEELHVMNYNEAIISEKDKWDYAVKEEHDRMVNNKVWKSVPIDEIPEGTKITTSAWAMKKKSNGTYRARFNARGFEQVDGEHCDMDTKSSPVTCLVTIRIVMTLIIMTSWQRT
jgi:hypothetical protein